MNKKKKLIGDKIKETTVLKFSKSFWPKRYFSKKLEDSLNCYTEDANGHVGCYVVRSLLSKNVSRNAAQKLNEPIKESDEMNNLLKKKN